MNRTVVFVSGAPGSGKTTLAHPLAEQLGFPLFAKDTIKESPHRARLCGTPGALLHVNSFARTAHGMGP